MLSFTSSSAEVRIFPLPMPIRAWTLVIGLAVIDLVFAQLVHDGIAHEAHIGGLLVGWLFFRMQSISRRRPVAPARQEAERVVMVQQTVADLLPPQAAPEESTTFAVNVNVPAVVGVPEMVPVAVLSVRPPGKLPKIIEKV